MKSLLYGTTDAPAVHGKRDPTAPRSIPAGGVLDVSGVAGALRRRLEDHVDAGPAAPGAHSHRAHRRARR